MKIRLPWMSRNDRTLWRSAETLQDLGDRMVLWLTGAIASAPGLIPRYGPDPETERLVPTLAGLNRAGLVTTVSQPGLDERDATGHWRQRAGVSGFVDDITLLRRLVAAADEAGLRVALHTTVAAGPCPDGFVVTTLDGEPFTAFGAHEEGEALQSTWPRRLIGPGAHAAVVRAAQLTIVDPEYGRDDLLWPVLARACALPSPVPAPQYA
ncbi:DUF6919 domain-containing protein [Streptomyces sp. NPDC088748]|uniref:DUF6919 domain-containing protein n=1 Tax=Streptomyces sp. NPDC088748 TaxID=3365887 RepID=UPI0038118B85